MFQFASSCTIRKIYSSDFHKIEWKSGTWATEETVRYFDDNRGHVIL